MQSGLNIEGIYKRTELLIGREAIERLKKSKVCICGIGGVGSFAMEALARVGIGKIIIIDKDKVDITNINRQLIATVDNVDKPKVNVAKYRIHSINPNIEVIAHEVFITRENVGEYIDKTCDYVIDAIDSVDSKVHLIKYCYDNNIKIISSMGMAQRLDPLSIKVGDIYKTEMCPLAKVMRKKLKQLGVKKLKTVYSDEKSQKINGQVLGSISYVPSVAGLMIASEVVKCIIEEEVNKHG